MTTRLLTNTTKPTRRIWNAGANRGALRNIPALASLQRLSERHAIEIAPVDPVPGRAASHAAEARALGLSVAPVEGRIEEIVNDPDRYKGEPVIFNLDRAAAIASALAAVERHAAPVLFYQILVLPSGRMLGLRGVLRPEETELRAKARAFFSALGKVSERAGSRAVFGEGTDPAHAALEPALRARFFGEHCKDNLGKLLVGLEPESPPFEVSWDGIEAVPLHIVTGDRFGDPYAIVEAVAEHPESTIARGRDFVVAEVTSDAVRLHEARRRSTDARVVVRGTSTIDERSTVESAQATPRVAETLRAMPTTTGPFTSTTEAVPNSRPVDVLSGTERRNSELAREAALVFATALVGALQSPAATASVRTNELTRTNPIRTTD